MAKTFAILAAAGAIAVACGAGASSAGTSNPPSGGGGSGTGARTWSTYVPGTGAQGMSGGVSNGALGDRSPQGRPDTIVFATAEYSGTGNLYLHHGTLGTGPTTRITVSSTSPGGTTPAMLDVTAVQDTVNYDFHLVGSTSSSLQLHYWRYRPTRNPGPGPAQGKITGWTELGHVVLSEAFLGVGPTVIEALDGNGEHRLVVLAQEGNPSSPPARVTAFATTPEAGVTPSGPTHFAGLGGETIPSVVATHGASTAWATSVSLEQHSTSRTLECFAMSGLHGQEGEHSRTPFHLSAANPSRWEAGPTEWYSRVDGVFRGTAGGFSARAPDDSVWWTWSGAGHVQRFSRVSGDGVVTHDVIPSPGNPSTSAGAGQFPFMNHMAISAKGKVLSLVTTTSGPGEVRLRLWDGTRWSELRVAGFGTYNMQGCGFRGTTVVDGLEWAALFVTQGSSESLLAAASLPR